SSITRIRGFNPNSSVTPQDSVPANCLDEKGHLMTNEDGFIQLRCLDRNAQIAESGDASAIRNLTDTVFEFSQIGRVPGSFLEEFKDRLVRSELKFRAGDKKGIKEENV